jgi:hypothetical protein
MKWDEIKVSENSTHFIYDGKHLFGKSFIEVLKFHSEGLATVKEESGYYHIDLYGKPLYKERYTRAFGFYCKRAAVVDNEDWFHLTEKGNRAYTNNFSWVGNFQENLCSVRDIDNKYFHIDLDGQKTYKSNYLFCGDYKDGYACVKLVNGFYKHINKDGSFLNNKEFHDLGVFHKNIAIAKDKGGWYHIDKNGDGLYKDRYLAIEPFYNGFSLVTMFDTQKLIINEQGCKILNV